MVQRGPAAFVGRGDGGTKIEQDNHRADLATSRSVMQGSALRSVWHIDIRSFRNEQRGNAKVPGLDCTMKGRQAGLIELVHVPAGPLFDVVDRATCRRLVQAARSTTQTQVPTLQLVASNRQPR
jgi:hypothetical protein